MWKCNVAGQRDNCWEKVKLKNQLSQAGVLYYILSFLIKNKGTYSEIGPQTVDILSGSSCVNVL